MLQTLLSTALRSRLFSGHKSIMMNACRLVSLSCCARRLSSHFRPRLQYMICTTEHWGVDQVGQLHIVGPCQMVHLPVPPSGCVVECRSCNRSVADLNLSRGNFAPRSTQLSIPQALGSVMSTSCSWEGKGGYSSFCLRMNSTRGVWAKLCYPLTMRAIPECLRDVSCIGTIQIDFAITFTLPILACVCLLAVCSM